MPPNSNLLHAGFRSSAAQDNSSVPDYSTTGANQLSISSVLQAIATALPNYNTCNNWLQGAGINSGVSGLQQIQTVLSNNTFGHGTFYTGNQIDYNTSAFSGNLNPDKTQVSGVPFSATFVVNDVGAFFNLNPDDDDTKIFKVGPRKYLGNTLWAQAEILIHETAHQITVKGFLSDRGKRKIGKDNDKLVDINCRQLIEGLQ